jgi:RNA polymerase sigma-70 factor (ECF subfamily)
MASMKTDAGRVDRLAAATPTESEAAIVAFVTEHYDRLLGLARLVCRDTNDAADAVQVGLEQAWRRRSTLRDDANLRSWLDRIVVREAVRVSRARRSWLGRIFTPTPDVKWIEPSDRRSSEPGAFAALRAAFQRLSPEQRAVVALHLHTGYSVAETADIVGAPVETVRSRLRLARQQLRRELEESRP